MKKIFPTMDSQPIKILIFALIPCWILAFVIFPMFMPLLGLGLWEQSEKSVWLEIGYHIANGIILFSLMSSYLKEEWFMVSIDAGYYLKHAFLTVALMIGTEQVLLGMLYVFGIDITNMVECLPVVEMSVSHTPLYTVDLQPIFGTIALSVFAPVSICTLFYCLGFAPICCKKPLLAYLCIAVITLIPPVIDIIWRGDATFVLSGYLVSLPIHLLAC